MPDPLDQLRAPIEPVTPSPAFAHRLGRQMRDALGVAPSDLVVPLDHTEPRSAAMTTTGTTTSASSVAERGAPGIHAVTPYLAVHDGAAAIDFYAAAFGAVEEFRVVADDGRIGHAELRVGDIHLQLSDEYPEMDILSPQSLGGAGLALSITVDDCDAVWERALAAGAQGQRPPEDQPHGNRMAVLRDPFGHRWFMLQPIEAFDLATYAERTDGTGFAVQAPPEDAATPAASPATPSGAGRVSPDGIWPALHYADAPAAIRFAVDVLGFEELLVVTDPASPEIVRHSELRWPEGGIVQIATADRSDSIYAREPGNGVLYIITADPFAVLERCEAAGADIADPLREVDYGGRVDHNFTVRDAEQNLWCFGSYGANR